MQFLLSLKIKFFSIEKKVVTQKNNYVCKKKVLKQNGQKKITKGKKKICFQKETKLLLKRIVTMKILLSLIKNNVHFIKNTVIKKYFATKKNCNQQIYLSLKITWSLKKL